MNSEKQKDGKIEMREHEPSYDSDTYKLQYLKMVIQKAINKYSEGSEKFKDISKDAPGDIKKLADSIPYLMDITIEIMKGWLREID